MLKLYEYAVIKQDKKDKSGTVTEVGDVVVPVKTILARDDDQARLLAARDIPEDQMKDLDRLTVVLRPF